MVAMNYYAKIRTKLSVKNTLMHWILAINDNRSTAVHWTQLGLVWKLLNKTIPCLLNDVLVELSYLALWRYTNISLNLSHTKELTLLKSSVLIPPIILQ